MKTGKAGAKVKFCGHEGWFIADIYVVGNVNVVLANGPVTPGNLIRPADEATHHLIDFPVAGCWNTKRGIFAVPQNQVKTLPNKKYFKKK